MNDVFNLATQRHQAGALGEAEQLYRQVVSENPAQALAWNRLGMLSYQRRQFDAAQQCLARAVAAEPNNPEFYFNLGLICTARQQLEPAVAAFRRCVELKPDSAAGQLNLGMVLRMAGDLPGAIAHFRLALAADPKYADAYNCLGSALRITDDLEGCMTAYRRALELRPDYAEVHANLAQTLHLLGRLRESIEGWQRALRLQPNNARFFKNLGLTFVHAGMPQQAMPAFDNALRLEPKSPDLYWNLTEAARLAGPGTPPQNPSSKLPFVGDKVVMIRCDPQSRARLESAGLHGGYGGDLWLRSLAAVNYEPAKLAELLTQWLEWTRNEAAMAGTTCTVWANQIPQPFAEILRRAAGSDLVEIESRTAEQIHAEFSSRAIHPPDTENKIIAVLAIRNGGVELLPHWLDHYVRLGVDEILLGIFDDVAGDHLAEIDRLGEKWTFHKFSQRWTAAGEAEQYAQRQSACRRFGARPQTWIIHADLDELHQYPAPLRMIVDAANEQKINVIYGEFMDRVAADGTLPPVRPAPSLWEQYPVECRLTERILRGGTSKVMLSRFGVPVRAGHHVVLGEPHRPPPIGPATDYRVAHFKWHAAVIERMRWGLQQPQPPEVWKREVQRFFAWLERNGGRVNVDDPALEAKTASPQQT